MQVAYKAALWRFYENFNHYFVSYYFLNIAYDCKPRGFIFLTSLHAIKHKIIPYIYKWERFENNGLIIFAIF